jgi:hypothetical protein
MRRLALVLTLALIACKREPPPVADKPAPSSSSFTPLDEPEDAGLPPVNMGPEGSDKAVYALLRGERPANRFPTFATDDGGAVDDGLRDEIAPRFPGKVILRKLEGEDAETLTKAVTARMSRFSGCYQRGLQFNPALGGTINVIVTFGRDGRVIEAKNGGAIVPDSRVVQCVVDRMSEIVVPQPKAEQTKRVIGLDFDPGR